MKIFDLINEAVIRDKEVLIKKCSIKIDSAKIESPCTLYSIDKDKIIATYFWENITGNNFFYGFKVCKNDITDYYKIANFSEKVTLEDYPGKHCIEYNPTTGNIISEYIIDHRNELETKLKDGKPIQYNHICRYDSLPDEYKEVVNERSIPHNYINGYTVKNGEKMLLLTLKFS